MKTLSSTEAKAKFNAVLAEVAATGQPVTITNHGKPVAVLRPAEAPVREFGMLAGLITVPDDFDDPMSEDELALWEGGE